MNQSVNFYDPHVGAIPELLAQWERMQVRAQLDRQIS